MWLESNLLLYNHIVKLLLCFGPTKYNKFLIFRYSSDTQGLTVDPSKYRYKVIIKNECQMLLSGPVHISGLPERPENGRKWKRTEKSSPENQV